MRFAVGVVLFQYKRKGVFVAKARQPCFQQGLVFGDVMEKNDQMMGCSSFYYRMGGELLIQDRPTSLSFLHFKFGRKRKLHFALRCRGRHGMGQ